MTGRWGIRLLDRMDLLRHINVHGRLVLNGTQFIIPVIKRYGYSNLYDSEPWMNGLLQKLTPCLEEGMAFFDVGANTGQTLLRIRSLLPGIPYLGFEPNPVCVFYLNELISCNGLEQCVIVPVGLDACTDIRRLSLYYGATDPAASVVEGFRPNDTVKQVINVPVFDFCSTAFARDVPRAGIVKIDVEGSELGVMQSLKEKIACDRPFILMEILPVYSTDNTARLHRQQALEQLLMELDYNIFRVMPDSTLIRISTPGVHSDMAMTNYLLVPVEEAKQIQDAEPKQ